MEWLTLAENLAHILYPFGEVTLLDKKGKQIAIYNECNVEHQQMIAIPIEIGEIRVRFDRAPLRQMSDILQTMLQHEPSKLVGFEDQLAEAIHQYLQKNNISLMNAKRTEKRDLVLYLYQEGYFDYKDASSLISEKLHTSRATVYNYLNWAKSVRKVKVHQVDAFTNMKFKGNPAGVVLEGDRLSEKIMKQITRELNVSETSFVLPSKCADFRLRYFTPSGYEVDFCGHSTVGALYMLAHEGKKQDGQYKVETKAGLIPMEIDSSEEDITVSFEALRPKMSIPKFSIDFLGIDSIQKPMVDKRQRQLFVMVSSLRELQEFEPDFKQLKAFCEKEELVSICLVTMESIDPKNDVHLRVFAPAVGIPEDPFTGSVLGGLVEFLPKKAKELRVEQGRSVGRDGFVRISIEERVMVHAHAVHLFSTEMELA